MWVIWPREGGAVNIRYQYGSWCLIGGDPNWHMIWEESR